MALGASALGGSSIGILSNFVQSFIDSGIEKARINARWEEKKTENLAKYQISLLGKRSPYSTHLGLITLTYCVCTLVCFFCGDIPVTTQSFSSQPSEFSLALGLFRKTSPDKDLYIMTYAGLGTYFMSPLAFIQTAVYSGIVPKRGG